MEHTHKITLERLQQKMWNLEKKGNLTRKITIHKAVYFQTGCVRTAKIQDAKKEEKKTLHRHATFPFCSFFGGKKRRFSVRLQQKRREQKNLPSSPTVIAPFRESICCLWYIRSSATAAFASTRNQPPPSPPTETYSIQKKVQNTKYISVPTGRAAASVVT